MKKSLNIIINVLCIIIIFLLQIYVFNKKDFFGVTANIVLSFIIVILTKETITMSYVYAVILGLISDILFGFSFGKFLIIYVLIVTIFMNLSKIYKNESKLYLILVTFLSTVIFECIMGIFNTFTKTEFVNVFNFILLILKESVINIALVFLIYLLFNKREKDY